MVGAVGAASQLLSTLLQKLASASSTSSSSSSSSTATASVSGFQQALPGDTKKSLTPPPTPTLNGDILSALIALQAQTGSTASASGDGSSPVQQLFSAMDSDGDGEVSQSEMESYIEKQGGTQAQADALFNSLDQGNSLSGGISEDQMQAAVTNARQSFQAHHHRHHHGMGGSQSGDSVANSLLQALDTNDDGSVSEDEFSDLFSANGGSASDAQNTFAALDTSGAGALTSADFAKAWNAYQAQQSAQSSGNMMISMLDKLGQAASVTA